MDYALFISLALYGVAVSSMERRVTSMTGQPWRAYTAFAERSPDKEGRWRRLIISLLMAILFYTVLKFVFIAAGIQSP